ncbi:hypothetical protein DFH09DRAFT_629346 [Mycena vulgaris]|nr:hypothetical protein DFH09DRAFT_629346 [Mycena vulgaris]
MRYHAADEPLIESMRLMLGLDHLDLDPFFLDIIHSLALFQDCTFPRLTNCQMGAEPYSLGNDVSTLTRVHINNNVHYDSAENDRIGPPSVRIPLPNLRYFEKPACFVPAIVAPGLREARLQWNPRETSSTNMVQIFVALNSLTGPDTPFYFSHKYSAEYCMQLVKNISRRLPHTTGLRLQSTCSRSDR